MTKQPRGVIRPGGGRGGYFQPSRMVNNKNHGTTALLPKDIHWDFQTLFSKENETMKPRITRLCIYPKDIQRITGTSERHSRNLILKIKTALNKEEHQVLTVQEFCTYMGIPYESIREIITD